MELDQLRRAIREARLARGLSQREVASVAGVTQSQLAAIEGGRVDPRISTLVQIGRALGLELLMIPRQSLPAVESLVRSTAPEGGDGVPANIRRSLERIRRRLLEFQSREFPAVIRARAEQALSLAGSVTAYRDWLRGADLSALRRIERFLKRAEEPAAVEAALLQVVTGLQELAERTVRDSSKVREPPLTPQRGVYSLEDEEP